MTTKVEPKGMFDEYAGETDDERKRKTLAVQRKKNQRRLASARDDAALKLINTMEDYYRERRCVINEDYDPNILIEIKSRISKLEAVVALLEEEYKLMFGEELYQL